MKSSQYLLYIFILVSFISRLRIFIRFREYNLFTRKIIPILVDSICLCFIIGYEYQNIKNMEKTEYKDQDKITSSTIKDIYSVLQSIHNMKLLKSALIFFATIRIITFLKLSFFINFYVRFFYRFFRKYVYLYLFPSWSILIISTYFYADNNSINLLSLSEAILYVRKSLYENIKQKDYKNASLYIISVNFAVLIFLRVFVFSLLYAGINQVFWDEIKNYKKGLKKFKIKLLGDYLFFFTIAPYHWIYYLLNLKNFEKEENDIYEEMKTGLEKHYNINHVDDITKNNIKPNYIEKFYSFFKDDFEKDLYTTDFVEGLKKNYFMVKIELEQRDVYVIGKRKNIKNKNYEN